MIESNQNIQIQRKRLKEEKNLITNKIRVCDIVDSCKREKIDTSDLGMNEIKLRNILNYLEMYKNI